MRAAQTPTTHPYTHKTPQTPVKTPKTPVRLTPESPEKTPKTSVQETLTETLTTPHTPVAEAVVVCIQQPTLQPHRQVALTHQHGCQRVTVACGLDVYAWERGGVGAGGSEQANRWVRG